MSTTPIKSAKLRNAVKAALGAAIATPLLFTVMPASAAQVGDTTFDVSGYVKFDAVYDIDGVGGAVNGIMASDAVGQIGADDSDGRLDTTVNQTRLRLSTNTETSFGDVHGYIEMDFYGSGGRDLRRRQAYIQWNNWTFGRAWSTFSDFNYGTTLNFGGPIAQVGQRVDLVRYTVDLGDAGTFDISLENTGEDAAAVYDAAGNVVTGPLTGLPGYITGLLGPGGIPIVAQSRNASAQLPALALRYKGAAGSFNYQVAGIVRQNKYDWSTGSDSSIGWGLNAGGSVALGTGTTLRLSTVYGEGINDGHYGFLTLGGTSYIQNDEVENNTLYGFIASASQKITDKMTANVLYSMGWVEQGPDETETEGHTLAVNLMYSPVEPLVFGVEYSRAYADVEGVGDADANVIQFSTIYNF